jgi:hypothetical protein
MRSLSPDQILRKIIPALMSASGQVTSFGSRSVNGGNGAEAADQDFVVCVRFPVCGDQKQTVGFRPVSSVLRPSRPLAECWSLLGSRHWVGTRVRLARANKPTFETDIRAGLVKVFAHTRRLTLKPSLDCRHQDF